MKRKHYNVKTVIINFKGDKMEKTLDESLNDLYRIGVIQGEHNINWTDEYNLLKHSKNYYEKIKTIADEYDIGFDFKLEDYRESSDDEEYYLWDRKAFDLSEKLKEHILIGIRDRIEISQNSYNGMS